jgi:hypothetical protein
MEATVENIKNIAKALGEFQAEVPTFPKGKQGNGYKYADLPSIIPVITPMLKKHGLILTQIVGNGTCEEPSVSVETILIHESGECLSSKIFQPIKEVPGKNGGIRTTLIQSAGSAITYLRRYSIAAMLGIVTDEDTDGSLSQNVKKSNPITKEQSQELKQMLTESKSDYDKFIKWLEKWFNFPISSIDEIPSDGFMGVKGQLEKKIFAQNRKNLPKPAAFTGIDWIIKFNKYASELWGSDGPEVQDINVVEYCSKHGVDYGNLTQEKAEMLVKRLEEEKQ